MNVCINEEKGGASRKEKVQYTVWRELSSNKEVLALSQFRWRWFGKQFGDIKKIQKMRHKASNGDSLYRLLVVNEMKKRD